MGLNKQLIRYIIDLYTHTHHTYKHTITITTTREENIKEKDKTLRPLEDTKNKNNNSI